MTTRSRRISMWLAAASLAATSLLSACYTLMQHPRLASLNYARPDSKRCLNCHTEKDLRALVIAREHSGSREPWRSYYDEPWWFDDYLRSDSTRTDDAPQQETNGNDEERR